MPDYEFSQLAPLYPEVVAEMSSEFTSHEFILCFAHKHQRQYVEALFAHRDIPAEEHASPFVVVHRGLVGLLEGTPGVECIGQRLSYDLLGEPCECAVWRRVQSDTPTSLG